MLFLIAFGVPEKSVFTRLFCVFATAMLANFQDYPYCITIVWNCQEGWFFSFLFFSLIMVEHPLFCLQTVKDHDILLGRHQSCDEILPKSS